MTTPHDIPPYAQLDAPLETRQLTWTYVLPAGVPRGTIVRCVVLCVVALIGWPLAMMALFPGLLGYLLMAVLPIIWAHITLPLWAPLVTQKDRMLIKGGKLTIREWRYTIPFAVLGYLWLSEFCAAVGIEEDRLFEVITPYGTAVLAWSGLAFLIYALYRLVTWQIVVSVDGFSRTGRRTIPMDGPLIVDLVPIRPSVFPHTNPRAIGKECGWSAPVGHSCTG